MKVKIVAEIWADIEVWPDDVVNSDTIGDYKAELDSNVGNGALIYLSDRLGKDYEEIKIIAAEPYEDGIDSYGTLLNNWQPEYTERMRKYENKEI